MIWAPEQIDHLAYLRAHKFTRREMATRLGLTFAEVKARIDYQWHAAHRLERRSKTIANTQLIPSHVLEERDRRLSVDRHYHGWLTGDPPPGYSALDRR